MEKALISVVTVCFNAEKEIENTIRSVINQNYSNIEYIIIDGGSVDGTVDLIEKYADKITYWVSEPDKGIYDAMNKGIKIASGEWIIFMNSGDLFVDENVLNNIFTTSIKEHVNFVYGNTLLNYNGRHKLSSPNPVSYLKKGMAFCHQSVFVRTKCMLEFNVKYKIAADFDFFYNAYKKYGEISFQYVNIPISIYEAFYGVSTNKVERYKEYLQIRKDRLGIIKLFVYRYFIARR